MADDDSSSSSSDDGARFASFEEREAFARTFAAVKSTRRNKNGLLRWLWLLRSPLTEPCAFLVRLACLALSCAVVTVCVQGEMQAHPTEPAVHTGGNERGRLHDWYEGSIQHP